MNITLQSPPRRQMPPLFRMSVMNGIKAAVVQQISCGIDINACDEKGRTALIIAASRGHEEICTFLLESGADPDVKDVDGNPVAKGHADRQRWADNGIAVFHAEEKPRG